MITKVVTTIPGETIPFGKNADGSSRFLEIEPHKHICHVYTSVSPGFKPGVYWWTPPTDPYVTSTIGGVMLNGSEAYEVTWKCDYTYKSLLNLSELGKDDMELNRVEDVWSVGLVGTELDEVSRLACLYHRTFIIAGPAEGADETFVYLTKDQIPILVSTKERLESVFSQIQQKHVSKSHSNKRRRG